MKKVIINICLISFLSLTACSEVRPFIDSRREAGQTAPVGQSTATRLAICYNPIWDDLDNIQQIADETCQKDGKKANPDGAKYFNCRLMTPNTAFYRCR